MPYDEDVDVETVRRAAEVRRSTYRVPVRRTVADPNREVQRLLATGAAQSQRAAQILRRPVPAGSGLSPKQWDQLTSGSQDIVQRIPVRLDPNLPGGVYNALTNRITMNPNWLDERMALHEWTHALVRGGTSPGFSAALTPQMRTILTQRYYGLPEDAAATRYQLQRGALSVYQWGFNEAAGGTVPGLLTNILPAVGAMTYLGNIGLTGAVRSSELYASLAERGPESIPYNYRPFYANIFTQQALAQPFVPPIPTYNSQWGRRTQ